MQHLRAIVRELRRLARVQLRDHARVRHEPRIAREQPRHILPQRHRARVERTREQRRREIGAAAAERRHGAVGGHAEEAGDDRDLAAREQRTNHGARRAIGSREIRRRAAERIVGVDDARRIDVAPLHPLGAQRRGDERRAQPLAARDDDVRGARRELAHRVEAAHERVELLEGFVDRRARPPRAGLRRAAPRAPTSTCRARSRADSLSAPATLPTTARFAMSSSASVTPAIAESTTTVGSARWRTINATACRTAVASASEAPPNLCT